MAYNGVMQIVHATYEVRLSLTKGKHRRLDAAFRACARLYNAALENWRSAYKTTSYWRGEDRAESPTAYDQMKELTNIRKDDPTYGALSVQIGRGVLLRLDRARNAFFRRVKKGGAAAGYPKYKSSRRWRSIEIDQPTAGMVTGKRGKTVLKVRGLPIMPIRSSRELPDSKRLKRVVVKRTANGVYASLTYAVEKESLPATGKVAGVDMGISTRMALSNGVDYERRETPTYAELQRRIAGCKRGSGNQRKLYRQLAKAKRRDAVRNRNELHRITTEIIRSNDFVAIEDLDVSAMMRSASGTVEKPGRGVSAKRGLNREIQTQSWGMARAQLEYKAAWRGRELIAVNPARTSQTCSVCRQVDARARKGKDYACARCGNRMDADLNAARVILALGLERLKAGGNPRRAKAQNNSRTAFG